MEEMIHQIEGEFKIIPMLLEEQPWKRRSKWEAPWGLWSPIR
jgi:hypothetical protein